MAGCIVLIGMPGAGKSTVGEALAGELGMAFVDTDVLVRDASGMSLASFIKQRGVKAFGELEEGVIAGLSLQNSVVATGGSVIFRGAAMDALKRLGTIVFIDVPTEELKVRAGDLKVRGVIGAEDLTLEEIYEQRLPLYRAYADVTVSGDSVADVVRKIQDAIEE